MARSILAVSESVLKFRTVDFEELSFKDFSVFSLAAILFSQAESFSNFGKGPLEEDFCANIMKSGHWPRTRCRLKSFYF